MSEATQLMLSVMGIAKTPGLADEPTVLMNRIRTYKNPIQALGGWDQSNDIFGALEDDFGFIRRIQFPASELNESESDRWISLMRWLIQGLCGWQEKHDPQYHKLAALFVVAHFCDFEGRLWDILPSEIAQNDTLLSILVKLAAALKCDFQSRGSVIEPIWERETVERFVNADADADWLTISELWQSFEHAVFPNVFHSQLIRCLCRFDFNRLIEASLGISQSTIAMQFVGALGIADRFKLGAATANTRMQFACVFETFFHHPKTETLGQTEQHLLSTLLLRIAQDTTQWQKWMTVFNRFPLRYPTLQAALGRTLATASEAAVQVYVDAIHLYPGRGGSRETVASCLREFGSAANEERRRLLWTFAYRRWLEWDYDVAKSDQYLFEIACSELDYAVVAYAVECLDDTVRTAAEKAVFDQLSVVDNRWHQSVTGCITDWNRLLSKLQPYAHATKAKVDALDFLPQSLYMPAEAHTSHYMKIMFLIR